jgi:hypothetical protein
MLGPETAIAGAGGVLVGERVVDGDIDGASVAGDGVDNEEARGLPVEI